MTLLTVLVFGVLVVGLVAVVALHRINRELERFESVTGAALDRLEGKLETWRWKDPVPFTPVELEKQRVGVEQAAAEVKECRDAWEGRWREKQTLSGDEATECRREARDVEHKEEAHRLAVQRLSMMILANARVRLGQELLSEARSRVSSGYVESTPRDLIDDAEGE